MTETPFYDITQDDLSRFNGKSPIVVTLGEGYMLEPFRLDAGCLPELSVPGLGIKLDDAAIAGKLYAGDWETPWLWFEDGSVADW